MFSELIRTALSMISVTEGLRKQLQSNCQLTHIELLELFRKKITSEE